MSMSIFFSRRSTFFNIGFLFLVLGLWLFFYICPALKGFLAEEHLFYGRVSYAAVPSIFGGSDIPFLDKTMFQINGDSGATFVLYASQEILEDMSEWFSFGARNVSSIPLEITATKISKGRFVVTSMASSDGEVEWDTIMEYQFYWALIYIIIEAAFLLLFIVFMILGIRAKRRVVVVQDEEGTSEN